jgi:hypothetical protein
MKKITTIVLAAAFIFSSNVAFAQGNGGVGGSSPGGVGSGTITNGNSSIGSPIGGPGTTPSTTTGLGNGNNPGIGNMSDPSVRANPGINANGPCNGARSTSGNNTPSC